MPLVRATPGMDILTNNPNVPIYQGNQIFQGRTGNLFPQSQDPMSGVNALQQNALTPAINPMQPIPQSSPAVQPTAPMQPVQNVAPEQQRRSLGQRFADRVRGWFGGGPGKPRTGQGEFWLGKQEEQGLQDILTPEQINLVKQVGPEGVKWLLQQIDNSPIQDTLSGVIEQNLNRNMPFNFAPFREQAINRFNEETLPGIFERFTSLGKGAQSTGAFQGMLARGGADLNRGLAALEQDYLLKNRQLESEQGFNQQRLLQDLLKNQQHYGLSGKKLALDLLKLGLLPTAAPYSKPGTSGALPEIGGSAAKAALQALAVALL